MEQIKKLLLENKAWAKSKTDVNESYFKDMSNGQSPEYLWIGCADSRVPVNEITQSHPGEIFVHRNIANLVVHTDMNLMSVVSYAVENLKVNHVIICGHYNCGGVKAALMPNSLGLIDNWIRNIKDTYFVNKVEVDAIANETDKVNRLVELSVVEQVRNMAETAIIQKSWKERQKPYIHGWVYDIFTGHLKELITMSSAEELDEAYRYKF